jgi:hypothetical protein
MRRTTAPNPERLILPCKLLYLFQRATLSPHQASGRQLLNQVADDSHLPRLGLLRYLRLGQRLIAKVKNQSLRSQFGSRPVNGQHGTLEARPLHRLESQHGIASEDADDMLAAGLALNDQANGIVNGCGFGNADNIGNAPMTALDRLTLTFMQIPMTEDRRMELHKLVKEAEEEQDVRCNGGVWKIIHVGQESADPRSAHECKT